MSLRVRFAPSPTGSLHVGNARTALFNWLYARKEHGRFILRVEDTDLQRSTDESVASILADLRWLGLNWDEGHDAGGPHAPYRQSQRLESYRQLAQELVKAGRAYLCYDSEAELETDRQDWLVEHVKKRHPHRDLSPDQRAEFEAQGRKPSVRFATDDLLGEVVYDDIVRGEVRVELAEIRDFNLLKSDGMPMYNFAVVADDHAMDITHVIRGEDGISNTPRQLLLYQALSWTPPQFGHVSFILGPDGQKLSKRHGGGSIADLRERGYLPEAVVNYLGLLGLGGQGEGEEIFSLAQLTEMFASDRLIKKASIFDFGKLDFLNGHYLRLKSGEELAQLAAPFLKDITAPSHAWLIEALELFKGNAQHLSELAQPIRDVFLDVAPSQDSLRSAQAFTQPLAPAQAAMSALLDFPADAVGIQAKLKEAQKASGVKGKDFYMPLRLALTGVEHGPELPRLMLLLGGERIQRRLAAFIKAMA